MSSKSTQNSMNCSVASQAIVPTAEWGSRHRRNLFAQAVCGNTRAFNELFRPYERDLYLVSLAIAGDPELAEMVALDALYRAFIALGKLTEPGRLRTWLIELVVAVGREFAGMMDDCPPADWELSAKSAWNWPQLDPVDPETRSYLTKALLKLPQLSRVVIVLRDCLHCSSREVAQILAVSPTTVNRALCSARLGIYLFIESNVLVLSDSRRI